MTLERYKWAVECCLAGVGRALRRRRDARGVVVVTASLGAADC